MPSTATSAAPPGAGPPASRGSSPEASARPAVAPNAASAATPFAAPSPARPPNGQSSPGQSAEVASPVPSRRAPPRDGPLAEGVEAFRAGRWEQAADAFRAALRRDPDDADAQFNLALTEERLGQADRARSAYQAALRLDPDHVPSLVNLARLERQ